jgi:hypothetical protein
MESSFLNKGRTLRVVFLKDGLFVVVALPLLMFAMAAFGEALASSLALPKSLTVSGLSLLAVVLCFTAVEMLRAAATSDVEGKLHQRLVRVKAVMAWCFAAVIALTPLLLGAASVPQYLPYAWRIETSALVAIVAFACAEELWCRGVLHRLMLVHSSRLLTHVLLQGAFFCFIHIGQLATDTHVAQALAFYVSFSTCLVFMRIRFRSLLPCMAIHCLWNVFQHNSELLLETTHSVAVPAHEWSVRTTLIAIAIAGALAFWMSSRRSPPRESGH